MISEIAVESYQAKNRRKFERMLSNAHGRSIDQIRPNEIDSLARFATNNSIGTLSRQDLDEFVAAWSAHHLGERKPSDPSGVGVLFVLSGFEPYGGHARVVKAMVQKSKKGSASILLFSRARHQQVRRLVESFFQQEVIFRRYPTKVVELTELRQEYRRFRTVFFCLSPGDVLPLTPVSVGLGRPAFVLLNHADHRFLVGSRWFDYTLETRTWGAHVSLLRGVKDPRVVGIPLTEFGREGRFQRSQIRQKLGIAEGDVCLIAVGAGHKFVGNAQTDFPKEIGRVLAENQSVRLVVVGANSRYNSAWKRLSDAFKDRVLLLRPLEHRLLPYLYRAADIGLDSFPISGGTVALEMLREGLPVISLDCVSGHLDFQYSSLAFARSLEQWHSLVRQSIESRVFRNDLKASLNASKRDSSPEISFGPLSYESLLSELAVTAVTSRQEILRGWRGAIARIRYPLPSKRFYDVFSSE